MPSTHDIERSSAYEQHSVERKSPVDADAALEVVGITRDEGLHLDDRASKRIVRRADFFIMPWKSIARQISASSDLFCEKGTSLSYASVMNFQKDLFLTTYDYAWLGSTFFFGYLGLEFVTGRLLQRLPLAKYVGCCAILWGVVLCCFAAADSYAKAIGLRFILGALQACATPALILVISQWYTKAEQSARTAIWVMSSGPAQIIGGLASYGIARRDPSQMAIAPWKVMFLLFGCLTIAVGVVVLALLPDSQRNAWWLSREDRVLAIERIRVNQQGIGNRTFKLYQLKEAFTDIFVWQIFVFSITANIPTGGLTNYFSEIILSFGFTAQQSLLYGTPAGAVAIVVILFWGYLTHKSSQIVLWGVAALLIALVGAILIVTVPLQQPTGRLIGYYLTTALPAGEASVLSLISSNVAGHTKKTTAAAVFFIGYCVGNIIGPQTFSASSAPQFVSAEVTIIVLFAACILNLIGMYAVLRRRNRCKSAAREAEGVRQSGTEFLDLTDRENTQFVYSL